MLQKILALEARRRIRDQMKAVRRKMKSAKTRSDAGGSSCYSDDDDGGDVDDDGRLSNVFGTDQSETESTVLDRRKSFPVNPR